MFDSLLNPSLAHFILRIVLGVVFVAHGYPKLFKNFSGTAGWFDSIGFRPGKFWALVAGGVEFFGGLPSDPSNSISGVRRSLEVTAPAPEAKFFSEAEAQQGEEPVFESKLESLRPQVEDESPAEHPLYSPPTNPHIEGYIARRAAARK